MDLIFLWRIIVKKYIIKIVTVLAIISLVVLDQWSKAWISANLKGHDNIVWLPGVFELEYLENSGAAFSSFVGKQGFLIVVSSIVALAAIIEFIRIPNTRRYIALHVAFAMLIAGAIGNLIDRIAQGYVVDFFYFVPINFPRFNVADICVTLAVPLFIILFFWVYKEDETAFLFRLKKKESV